MSDFKGKTVLVTGGAQGLGRLMAERAHAAGAAKLVLWDINAGTLNDTAAALRGAGAEVLTYVVDVSDLEQIQSTAEQVLNEAGPVHVLFNNAGIVVGRPFVEHSHEDIERSIRINVLGVMHVARCFLPAMIENGGHIVNIASASGLLPVPKMCVYASSKWAVIGWSESLRVELQGMGQPVRVLTVNPSYINTGMFEGAKAPLLTPITQPDWVVGRIMKAVERDMPVLNLPFLVNLVPLMRGVLSARLFDLIGGRWFRIYSSMDDFKGHGGAGQPTT